MMLRREQLLPLSWAAINVETMLSQAWSDCFHKHHDLKFDDYKQVIYAVMAQCSCFPEACTLSHVQKTIANAYSIDQKTVAARIQRLVDENFLSIQQHPTDKRKKLIEPTEKLIVSFGKFNERVKSIVDHVREQISCNRYSTPIQKLNDSQSFDVLKALDDEGPEDAKIDELRELNAGRESNKP